jgi:hypothetical protein
MLAFWYCSKPLHTVFGVRLSPHLVLLTGVLVLFSSITPHFLLTAHHSVFASRCQPPTLCVAPLLKFCRFSLFGYVFQLNLAMAH